MTAERPFSVAVFAGHSGGHLFPALAFAEVFGKRFAESRIHLVTSEKGKALAACMPPGVFEAVHFLKEFPFPAGISLRSLEFLLKFPKAFLDSSFLLSKIKPCLCVGFGSYVSYPGLVLAARKKIPTLIHEQNRVAGKATRMLAGHVDLLTTTFPETLGLTARSQCVGLPLRSRLRQAAMSPPRPAAAGSRFQLLIVGGSQGSQSLNEIIFRVFSAFSSEELKKIAVTHIAGAADFPKVRETYQKLGIFHEVHPFYEDMQELYAKADMAITRAGANTLFELALFGVPAVVIPYPYAGGHQSDNASYFAKRGAILFIEEDELAPEWLCEQIRMFRDNEQARLSFVAKIRELACPQAADDLADRAGELLRKEKKWELSKAI